MKISADMTLKEFNDAVAKQFEDFELGQISAFQTLRNLHDLYEVGVGVNVFDRKMKNAFIDIVKELSIQLTNVNPIV